MIVNLTDAKLQPIILRSGVQNEQEMVGRPVLVGPRELSGNPDLVELSMLRITMPALLILNLSACGRLHNLKEPPSDSPKPPVEKSADLPPLEVPIGWRVMTSTFFQFAYPDPEGKGPTNVTNAQEGNGFWLGLDGGGGPYAGSGGEEIVLFGYGTEFTDAAACTKMMSDAKVNKIHNNPTVLQKDESGDFAVTDSPGKHAVYHRFYVIGGPSACLDLLFYDATLHGYDNPVAFDDQTDAGNFLRTVAGGFRSRGGK